MEALKSTVWMALASEPGFGLSGDLDRDRGDRSHLWLRRDGSSSIFVLGVPSELACSSYLAFSLLYLDSHAVKASIASSCFVRFAWTRHCLS